MIYIQVGLGVLVATYALRLLTTLLNDWAHRRL